MEAMRNFLIFISSTHHRANLTSLIIYTHTHRLTPNSADSEGEESWTVWDGKRGRVRGRGNTGYAIRFVKLVLANNSCVCVCTYCDRLIFDSVAVLVLQAGAFMCMQSGQYTDKQLTHSRLGAGEVFCIQCKIFPFPFSMLTLFYRKCDQNTSAHTLLECEQQSFDIAGCVRINYMLSFRRERERAKSTEFPR